MSRPGRGARRIDAPLSPARALSHARRGKVAAWGGTLPIPARRVPDPSSAQGAPTRPHVRQDAGVGYQSRFVYVLA